MAVETYLNADRRLCAQTKKGKEVIRFCIKHTDGTEQVVWGRFMARNLDQAELTLYPESELRQKDPETPGPEYVRGCPFCGCIEFEQQFGKVVVRCRNHTAFMSVERWDACTVHASTDYHPVPRAP